MERERARERVHWKERQMDILDSPAYDRFRTDPEGTEKRMREWTYDFRFVVRRILVVSGHDAFPACADVSAGGVA